MPPRYWVGGTATWDNVTGTKWSATSGGAGGSSAPTAADDVFIDNKNAPNWAASTAYALGVIRCPNTGNGFFYEVTVAGTSAATEPVWPTVVGNTVTDGTVTWTCRLSTVTTAATATCLTANFTGFVGTFNAATSWNIQTSLTFGAGMTITGTGTIIKNANGGTWTFNGKTYTGGWSYPTGNGFTTTIGDDLVFDGSISGGTNSNLTAASSRTITVRTNLTWAAGVNLNNVSFIMGGTGNLSGIYTRSGGTPTITINTPGGTINHNATLTLATIVFTYVAGTWNSTSTIQFSGAGGASIMNNVSAITFASMSFAANNGQSVTLNSDMYVTGGLGNGTTNSFINGTGRLYIGGNITPTQPIGGTATIEMYGSSNGNLAGGTLANSLIINKSLGAAITLTGNLVWGASARQLILTSGIFNPQTFGISIPNSISVEISGMTFWNLTIPGGNPNTITQNALNTIQNSLVVASNGAVTFAGTAGWTCANFLCSTSGRTITLQNSITYTTTNNANFVGADLSRITMTSNDPSLRAIWTLDPNATQSMIYVNGTRIDSSQGQTIWTFAGVRNATINWNVGSKPETVAWLFVF